MTNVLRIKEYCAYGFKWFVTEKHFLLKLKRGHCQMLLPIEFGITEYQNVCEMSFINV